MSWYEIFKFLHVAFSIAWIGGGLVMVILAIAAYGKDPAESLRIIKNVLYLGNRVFLPSAAGALVTGILTASFAPFSLWGQAWLILGLLGWAATFTIGNWFIRPRAERFVALEAKEGASANVIALGQEMLSIAKFDYIMLFTVVADMVIKPIWSDWYVILIFLLVIAAGAWFFLVPVLRPQIPARA